MTGDAGPGVTPDRYMRHALAVINRSPSLAVVSEESFNAVTAWTGIFTGVSGVILSVVAIIFAVYVQRDANAVSRQTIESIKKIEADVDKLSSDTTQLIKAAWDQMVLSNFPRTHSFNGEVDGVTGSESTNGSISVHQSAPTADVGSEAALDEKYDELRRELAQVSRLIRRSQRPSLDHVAQLRRRIDASGPGAAEILKALTMSRHLTSVEIDKLRELGSVGESLNRLMDSGLISPATSKSPADEGETVWWINPNVSINDLNAALLMARSTSADQMKVRDALEAVGYFRKRIN